MKKMCFLICFCLILRDGISFMDVNPPNQIFKYCREKDRLIESEEFDEYLLIEATINSTVLLDCQFWYTKLQKCSKNQDCLHFLFINLFLMLLLLFSKAVEPNPIPKIWYFENPFENNATEKEVELGMNSNVSLNRVYRNTNMTLVIKTVLLSDAGIYRCHGIDGEEYDKKYNYRIERESNEIY